MAEYITVTDFSLGQNNAFDPRSLRPLTTKDNYAEAQRIENFDLGEKGALVTANGYETFFDLELDQPIQCISSYVYDNDNRYLLATCNDEVYQLRKYSSLIIHDCDAYDSGTYGTFVGTSDMTSVATDSTRQRGTGSVSGNISTATSADDFAVLTVDPLTAVDISTYEYVELFVYLASIRNVLNTADVFEDITIRIGSSSTDYYERTFTEPAAGSYTGGAWHGIRFRIDDVSDATTVGSPNLAAIDYLKITFNYDSTYAGGTVRVDDIRAVKASDDYTKISLLHSGLWTNTASNLSIVNDTHYTANGFNYVVIYNDNQNPVGIRHVGDGMLVVDTVTSLRTHAMQSMCGFLFLARGSTLHYTDSETFSFNNTIAFSADIVALCPTFDNKLLVQLSNLTTEVVEFTFDDTNVLVVATASGYKVGTGGVSQKSVVQINSDSISLTTDGVNFFGQDPSATSATFVPRSVSWTVDKLLNKINRNEGDRSAGVWDSQKKQYMVSIPAGTQQLVNNETFVYHTTYIKAWTYRSGLNIAHAVNHRLADNKTYEVFFGSTTDSIIYKFNNLYDYDSEPYVRRWVSKVFNMGYPSMIKAVDYIEIAGAMPRGATFYVIIRADGEEKTFKIDGDGIILASPDLTGFFGNDYFGDTFYGGSEAGDAPYETFRFVERIMLSRSVREAREFEVEIYQNAAGQPIKIDFLRMKYSVQPEDKVPDRHINNNLVANLEI